MSEFKGNVWEGVFSSFEEASREGEGFQGTTWLQRSLEQAKQWIADYESGKADSDSQRVRRYSHLPQLVRSLAETNETLNIIDFGGGMGSMYLDAKQTVDVSLRYTIIDLEETCEAARSLFSNYSDIVFDCNLEDYFDSAPQVLYSNSAIQYVDDWENLLQSFHRIRPEYILLDEVYVGDFDSFVSNQIYYESTIPHRFFNNSEFIEKLENRNYKLLSSEKYPIRILNKFGNLPMENFPEENRLDFVSSLLLKQV